MRRISRALTVLAASLALSFAVTDTSLADKRVALVIGNSAYRHAPPLPNPASDAGAIGRLLQSAGFVVVTRQDLGVTYLRRTVRDFLDMTRDADMAVVYYAGHGIEVGGVNYLVPTDAMMVQDIDVEDESVSLDRVLRILEPAKQLRLVILDACRENPFAQGMKRTFASRLLKNCLDGKV
jgi:uncharacterized caspase-like protein